MKIKGVGYIEPSGLNLQPRNRKAHKFLFYNNFCITGWLELNYK